LAGKHLPHPQNDLLCVELISAHLLTPVTGLLDHKFIAAPHQSLCSVSAECVVVVRLMLMLNAVTLIAAGSQVVDCCLGCCYHGNTLIVAMAAEIYVGIVSLKWKGITDSVYFSQLL